MYALATTMIRMDHTQVQVLAQQYAPQAPASVKRALVNTICAALELHAQLEEEIFYPALRSAGIDTAVIDKSIPEHDQIRELIRKLRETAPTEATFDEAFMALMRTVIRHVADEETTLLPDAEQRMGQRLWAVGMEMAWRRAQLTPRYLLQWGGEMMRAGAGEAWGAWLPGLQRVAPKTAGARGRRAA